MKSKRIVFVVIFVLIAILAINQFVLAAPIDPEALAAQTCAQYGGTFVLTGEGKGVCYNFADAWAVNRVCGSEDYGYVTLFGDINNPGGNLNSGLSFVTNHVCGFVDFSQKSIKEQGRCKFTSIESGYLGGTISVTGMGAPSVLRLKSGDVTYKLPVVVGSIKQNADGSFTADYYTIDPFTSQPLVQPGAYQADCLGAGGPAGVQFDITIGR